MPNEIPVNQTEVEVTSAAQEPQNPKPAAPADSSMGRFAAAVTAADLVKEIINTPEDEFIPWEEFTLPSRGVYYGGKLPGGIVRVKGMGIHADKILATQRLAQSGQSIDYLFKHCVELTDGMSTEDLLAGDRVYLLYLLRGITHGNDYEFIMECPSCEARVLQRYDLNELISTVTYPDISIGDEPFKVSLPYMSKRTGHEVWVKVRFMRGRDISSIANRQKFNKRVHSGMPKRDRSIVIDQAVTENLSLIISAFGGADLGGEVVDQIHIKSLVDKLHASDTATIREFLREKSPGIDTTIQASCPECGASFRTELPITESFFRPTSNRAPGGT